MYLKLCNFNPQSKTNHMKKNYKGYELEITKDGMQCVAYLNGEPKFGTFSQLDKLSAYEKMIIKIDGYEKK